MFWLTFYLGYAFVGLLLLEKAWRQTAKLRREDKERDEKYPAFSRTDIYKLQKWRLAIGAVTVLPLRAFIHFTSIVLNYLVTRPIMFGWDSRTEMSASQRYWQGFFTSLCGRTNLYASLIFVRK